MIGQTASFDLLIQLPRDHEIDGDTDLGVPNVYAAQAHFDIHGDVDAVNAVDGDPNTPGFQATLDDERLAFEGKEALRTTPPINEDTAQYWAVLNEFYSDSGNEATGDLFVTELGSPDPNDPGHRIMPLVGDDNGRIFLARFTIIGQEEGTINIDLSDVILVPAEGLLDPVLPEVDVSGGTIVVEQPNQVLVADLVLQGIQRPDPAGWVGDDAFNPVPITFKFYHPDEDVENRFGDAQPALERECNPMIKIENEGFGTCVIRNLGLNLGDSSTWDIAATGPHTLTNLRLGVTISVGLNPADMGTLLEGGVDDGDGGTDSGSTSVTVNNLAPTLSNLSGDTIDEGGTATVSGTITDPGADDTFDLVIDWGDGNIPETFADTPQVTSARLTSTPTMLPPPSARPATQSTSASMTAMAARTLITRPLRSTT